MRWIRYCFAAFIVSALVSQSMMDAFSVLLSGALIAWFFRNRPVSNSSRRDALIAPFGLEKIWILWMLVVAVGFALHPLNLSYGASRVIEFKWVLLLYVFIEAYFYLKPNRANINFIAYLLLTISIFGLGFYLIDMPELREWRYGVAEVDGVRVGGFFVNPMTFAHSFVMFASVLLGVSLYDRKNWSRQQKILALLTLALSMMSLALTFTRGVWIGFAVAIVVGAFIVKPRWGLISVIGVFLTVLTLYKVSDQFHYRIDRTISEAQGASERKELWRAHWYIFKENPIFGLGYGQNTMQLDYYYKLLNVPEGTLQSHAHNEFLHLMAGTGLLGLLCYLIVWAYFILQMAKLWVCSKLDTWDRGIVFGSLIGCIAFLVGGLTEANFEHSKVRFAVMLVWAYIIYLAKKYDTLGWKLKAIS